MNDPTKNLNAFTISDPAVQECPYAYYRAMHEQEPVHYDPKRTFG